MAIYRYYATHNNLRVFFIPAIGVQTGSVIDVEMDDDTIIDFGFVLRYADDNGTKRPIGFIDENPAILSVNMDSLNRLNSRPEITGVYNIVDAMLDGTTPLANEVFADGISLGFLESNTIVIQDIVTSEIKYYGLQNIDTARTYDEKGFAQLTFTDIIYGITRNIPMIRLANVYLGQKSVLFPVEHTTYRTSISWVKEGSIVDAEEYYDNSRGVGNGFRIKMMAEKESTNTVTEFEGITIQDLSVLINFVIQEAYKQITNKSTGSYAENFDNLYFPFTFYSSENADFNDGSPFKRKTSLDPDKMDDVVLLSPYVITDYSEFGFAGGSPTREFIGGIFGRNSDSNFITEYSNIAEYYNTVFTSNLTRCKTKYSGDDAFLIFSYFEKEVDENQVEILPIDLTNFDYAIEGSVSSNGNMKVTEINGATPNGDEIRPTVFTESYNNISETVYEYNMAFNNYIPEFGDELSTIGDNCTNRGGTSPVLGGISEVSRTKKNFGLYQVMQWSFTGGDADHVTFNPIVPYSEYNDGDAIHKPDLTSLLTAILDNSEGTMNFIRNDWNTVSMPFLIASVLSDKYSSDKDIFRFDIIIDADIESTLLGGDVTLNNIKDNFPNSDWMTSRLPTTYQVVAIDKTARDQYKLTLFGVST